MNDSLALILGLACAGAGGELFVRGIVGGAIGRGRGLLLLVLTVL